MTTDNRESFEAELAEVVQRAIENGVTVRGATDVRLQDERMDYTIEITEVVTGD